MDNFEKYLEEMVKNKLKNGEKMEDIADSMASFLNKIQKDYDSNYTKQIACAEKVRDAVLEYFDIVEPSFSSALRQINLETRMITEILDSIPFNVLELAAQLEAQFPTENPSDSPEEYPTDESETDILDAFLKQNNLRAK